MVNKHWTQQPQTGTGPQEQRAACLPTKNWTLSQAYVVLTKVFYVKASGQRPWKEVQEGLQTCLDFNQCGILVK